MGNSSNVFILEEPLGLSASGRASRKDTVIISVGRKQQVLRSAAQHRLWRSPHLPFCTPLLSGRTSGPGLSTGADLRRLPRLPESCSLLPGKTSEPPWRPLLGRRWEASSRGHLGLGVTGAGERSPPLGGLPPGWATYAGQAVLMPHKPLPDLHVCTCVCTLECLQQGWWKEPGTPSWVLLFLRPQACSLLGKMAWRSPELFSQQHQCECGYSLASDPKLLDT